MKAKSSWFAALTICLLLPASSAFAGNIDVTIRDPAPLPYIYFGTGDASVTYSGVVFTQQAALSNGNFFIIGGLFSADPTVLSSQEQTSGVANILVTLPVFRSEEHTSELQSPCISYAVFCVENNMSCGRAKAVAINPETAGASVRRPHLR